MKLPNVTEQSLNDEIPAFVGSYVREKQHERSKTLANIIRAAEHEEQLNLDERITAINDIADTVDFLFINGNLSQNLSPENIELTVNGANIGTLYSRTKDSLRYLAPEQVLPNGGIVPAETITAAEYSVAVLAYEIMTKGTPPEEKFERFSQAERNVLLGTDSELDETKARALEVVFRKALAQNPTGRFRSAGAFANAYEKAVREPEQLGVDELLYAAEEADFELIKETFGEQFTNSILYDNDIKICKSSDAVMEHPIDLVLTYNGRVLLLQEDNDQKGVVCNFMYESDLISAFIAPTKEAEDEIVDEAFFAEGKRDDGIDFMIKTKRLLLEIDSDVDIMMITLEERRQKIYTRYFRDHPNIHVL